MADKHWSALPWDGQLGRDDEFRALEAPDVVRTADLALEHFDDIAILVLFSVFEAEVRSRVLVEVRAEALGLRQPGLVYAAQEAARAIEEGSFWKVLEPYKNPTLVGLVEEVNQVRRYRNWVAHGRRATRPADVTPKAAFERLSQFLAVFDASPSPGASTESASVVVPLPDSSRPLLAVQSPHSSLSLSGFPTCRPTDHSTASSAWA
jgi:hypothetical protein